MVEDWVNNSRRAAGFWILSIIASGFGDWVSHNLWFGEWVNNTFNSPWVGIGSIIAFGLEVVSVIGSGLGIGSVITSGLGVGSVIPSALGLGQ